MSRPRSHPLEARLPDLDADREAGPHLGREDDPQLVQALARGLDVLRAFSRATGPLGNRDLATLSGLPKATVSRLTYTLARLGYLNYDPALAKYQPGFAAAILGNSALQAVALRRALRPAMEQMAASFPVTVSLVALDRLEVVLLARSDANPAAGEYREEAGACWPLSLEGLARGLIVGMPQHERLYVLDYLERSDPLRWPARERDLYQALAEYQHQGYTISTGDASTGDVSPTIPAVSVPLLPNDGSGVFGLNCSAPGYRLPKERLVAELGPRLAELAGRVRRGRPAL